MIRNASLLAVLTAALAFAQTGNGTGCNTNRVSQAPAQTGNAVVFWNQVADNSIAVMGGKPPQQGSVDVAIVQVAVYDAVNAICGSPFTPYAVRPDVRRPALLQAAVAAAVHDVLIALYPAQAVELDQQYASYLDALPGHSEGKLNGIAVGQQTAAGILALRANDGRNAVSDWTPPPPLPGLWQPTPPAFLPPATPWIRFVTPWTMTSPSQFRAGPRPLSIATYGCGITTKSRRMEVRLAAHGRPNRPILRGSLAAPACNQCCSGTAPGATLRSIRSFRFLLRRVCSQC